MRKIGIIGDGQLGQLTALEGKEMGLETLIYGDGGENSPAGQVSRILDADGYKADSKNVKQLIDEKPDVITIEWENVPVGLLEKLKNEGLLTRPNSKALHIIQNRLREKGAINEAGAKTANYFEVNSLDDLINIYSDLGEGILKTTKDGYDGKGQIKIYNESDMEYAIEEMNGKQLIYEQIVNFKTEVSVIVGRRPNGEMAAFEPIENYHKKGILSTSTTKINITEQTIKDAKKIAMDIAESMGIEGLLAVEMFVLNDGSIIINELAPRPHNSGHLTIESYNKSQYEIFIRAILDLPFGNLNLLRDSKMTNLLGDEIKQVPGRIKEGGKRKVITLGNTTYYDYGKNGEVGEIPEGRKMGHKTEIIN